MYRAVALKVINEGIDLEDEDRIGAAAERAEVVLLPYEEGTRVLLDGEDVTEEIRTPEVDRCVGPVCEVPRVRRVLVGLQRTWGRKGRVIAEGRDMGTVVFPDADLKFFMDASVEERARRRRADLMNQGIDMPMDRIRGDIERRDLRDSTREHSPLKRANGAILLDTTKMDLMEQVDFIIDHLRRAGCVE